MKPVIMPKFGMDQTESTIVEWLKREGDHVEKGEPLVVVMTDKVNMEVEAPASGTLADIRARADETVPVTSVIASILDPGETPAEAAPSAEPPPLPEGPDENIAPPPTPVATRLAMSAGVDVSAIPGSGPRGRVTKEDVERFLTQPTDSARVRATPAARRVARERGIDLKDLSGSGPRGRIHEADVLAALAATGASQPVAAPARVPPEEEIVRLSGLRRIIARRMEESARTIPAFTLSTELDAGPIQTWCEEINSWLRASNETPISLTALLLKAVAWALGRHPWLNAHYGNEELHLFRPVHLGVAVAVERGLIVPVIRDAHQKGVVAIGNDLRALSERARTDQLSPEVVQGATFTVSNLGMFAVDHFTAIINPPQVGILALGRITDRLVPVDGQPTVRPMMTATLSADHRAVDGAVGARFLGDLATVLATPALLLA
ncbi:MAG: 2-oxo acid dehydrogenase subunit E2 [Ardenticatenaceae bacterium]|nr:2-oxo acid dehydrogenase subunit E2 [Ardenticatenaceae bacterium]